MKGIVWTAVFVAAILVCAWGLASETAGGGSAGSSAVATTAPEAEAPHATATVGFAGAASEATAPEEVEKGAAQPRRGSTGAPGWFAAGPRAGVTAVPAGAAASRGRGTEPTATKDHVHTETPTMGRTYGGFAVATVAKPVKQGDQFRLLERGSAATYGPYAMRDGEMIRVGDKSYYIELVEVEKTTEQIRLEQKLRRAMLPEMTFEDNSLMEVVDLLSRESDVNIVVSNVVRMEINPTITMRLKDIPVYDAIRYVTEVCDIRFRIDDHAVFISE